MMKKDSIDEMERIRKGLEEYLNQEIASYDEAGRKKSSLKGGGPIKKKANEKRRKRRKKSRIKKVFFILLLLCILVGSLWYYAVATFYSKVQYAQVEALVSEPLNEGGVINILLLGNDSRQQGSDGRSDAMILLSISKETKTIHLISLLRDMYVEIPGYKNNRLNAAYAYGGPGLLMETLEENLDISVNRYISVNFQAFADLVDAVGGVEIELTNEEVQYVNGFLVEYNMLEGNPQGTYYLDPSLSGVVHLNGPQALSYCRNRLIGNDFGRTERQRKVLAAIINQLPSALVSNPLELADGIFPNLTTNLSRMECMNLSLQAAKLLTYDIVQGTIPIEGSYSNASIRGMSVLEVDFEKNKEYIRSNIYGVKE